MSTILATICYIRRFSFYHCHNWYGIHSNILWSNLCAGLVLKVRSSSTCIRYQRALRVPSGMYDMKHSLSLDVLMWSPRLVVCGRRVSSIV